MWCDEFEATQTQNNFQREQTPICENDLQWVDLLLEDAEGLGGAPGRVQCLRHPQLLHAPLARLVWHPETPQPKIHKPRYTDEAKGREAFIKKRV